MKTKTVIASCLFALSFTFSLNAKINIWRDCGIGVMVFPDDPGVSIIVNLTISWTSDLGLMATSSRVSSADEFCKDREASAARFINDNIVNIEEETAKGHGTSLTSVLNIWGCQESTHKEIIKNVRRDYAKIIQSPKYEKMKNIEKAESYYYKLENQISTKFANQCRVRTS
ncbi:MAG: DUF3015 family protein [Leptospiraceae bacterium]|nr:DUF3015 family protein [Leptospiraceae bacterium]MCP5496669.1 DUF3015 family protein [Leptospiraceae bacterium]